MLEWMVGNSSLIVKTWISESLMTVVTTVMLDGWFGLVVESSATPNCWGPVVAPTSNRNPAAQHASYRNGVLKEPRHQGPWWPAGRESSLGCELHWTLLNYLIWGSLGPEMRAPHRSNRTHVRSSRKTTRIGGIIPEAFDNSAAG